MRIDSTQTRYPYSYQYDVYVYPDWGNPIFRSFRFERSDVVKTILSPSGWREPTPYVATVNSSKGPLGTWTNRSFGDFRRYRGNLREFIAPRAELQLPSENEGLRSQAEVGALLKLKDQRVNLAQAFAERGQVASMFANTITDIAGAYRKVKRGDVKGAARQLGIVAPKKMPKSVAGRWLELQYGWKPLLSDVHGTIEQFAKSDRSEAYRVNITESKSSKESHFHESLAYGGYYMPYGLRTDSEIRYKVRLDYLPSNIPLTTFASLGLTNPALLAWELIPFSFVLDWAVPIGDWLSSLDAAAGYTFLGGSITCTKRVNSRYVDSVDAGISSSVSSKLDGFDRKFRMDRTVYQTSPIPTLPRLKNPWSYAHAANAAALLTQVLSGAKAPR